MDIETIFWCGIFDLVLLSLLSSSFITLVVFRLTGIQEGEE
jgi:hypothetical protein